MNTQMIICMVIFAATLVSYMLNKIPMWLTALISMAALYITGCIDDAGALSGFSNVNTLLMACMFIVAAGFRRTSLVDGMCNSIMKLTHGSFKMAYFGYILLAVLLTNFISSPMVVYAIISPLLAALCDKTGNSRTQYMFPIMVVCVACCGILPLATSIQMAGQFTGFMETYGFTGMSVRPIDFTIAAWPVLIVVPLWAIFLGPKFTPKQPVVPIEALEKKDSGKAQQKLSPVVDKIGIFLFFATIICLIFAPQLHLTTWFVALAGSLLMVLFGVVDQKSALRDIPWDMLMLFVGALALGTALTNTGAGDMIGQTLATVVGGTHNNYVLGALFFIIPFLLTQFMLNRSVSAVFVPICLLTCSALGANPTGLVILVNAGSLTAFLTPMATPAVPMCMADGGYDLKAIIKSGALITANTALEQGRDVFAVPGPIDAPLSRGCNRLIADGAAGLITDSWDVLREYEAIYPHKILGERVELPRTLGYQAREEQARAKQAAAEEILSLPTLNLKTNDAGLTDDQIAILRTLKDGALQVDDLIEKTQIPTRRVLSALTMMELEGYVEQGSGKHFSLTVTLLEE